MASIRMKGLVKKYGEITVKISMSDTVAVMTGALKPEDLPAESLA
eukprot:gene40121-53004_t